MCRSLLPVSVRLLPPMPSLPPAIGLWCDAPHTCPYHNYCFRNVSENSVFDVAGMKAYKKHESRLYRV